MLRKTVLGAVLLFFWSGFLGVFLLVFSLLFGALNRDHNSTRRPPDREERTKFALGDGEKSAKFWAVLRRAVRRKAVRRRAVHGFRF